MNWITRITTLQVEYPDIAIRQQARRLLLLNLLWLVAAAVGTPVVFIEAIDDGAIGLAGVFAPFSVALAVLTHQLVQTRRLNWAGRLFVLNILASTLLTVFTDFRLDTPVIMLMLVPLTAAGVLLRRSQMVLMAVALIALAGVGGFIQNNVEMDATPLATTRVDNIQASILVMAGVIAVNALMLWIFATTTEDTQRQQREFKDLIDVTNEISSMLSMLPGTSEALNDTVERLRDVFGLYHVQVFLSDPSSGMPVMRASTGFIGRRLLEEDSLSVPEDSSPIHQAMRRRDPLLITAASPEDERSSFLPATSSELLLPLRVGDQLPLGVLDLHSTLPTTFSGETLRALVTLGHHMSVAIYGSQQASELHRSYRERDDVVEQLGAQQRELARLNRQLIGSTWGSYLETRRGRASGYDWRGQAVTPTRSESDILKQTLTDGEARLAHEDGTDILSVPIRLRGQTLGAIEMRRAQAPHWTEAALELAQAVCDRLALSLENARLFEMAQTAAQREQLVSEVTSQMQSSTDLQALLEMAVGQFRDALGATYTHIRIGSPQADEE